MQEKFVTATQSRKSLEPRRDFLDFQSAYYTIRTVYTRVHIHEKYKNVPQQSCASKQSLMQNQDKARLSLSLSLHPSTFLNLHFGGGGGGGRGIPFSESGTSHQEKSICVNLCIYFLLRAFFR